VEREIVQEQEEQLKAVEGVTKMTGECMDSMGRITLEFAVGTDMAEALLKVNTRLQQVREYPEDADQPVLASASSADQPIAWFILRPRMRPREELEAFARTHPQLRPALDPVLAAHSTGLAMRRLEGAAKAGIPGLDFSRAESPRFTGRAVAALATDADAKRWSGRALAARELADAYGFTDVDGRLPAGPLHERPRSAGAS